jgi:hypothetical protein
MSQLRKRKHGSETGGAFAVVAIIQGNINEIGLRLKVEREWRDHSGNTDLPLD